MRPFLLVSTRPEDEAIEAEYENYLRVTRLPREELEQTRFDALGLPPVDVHDYAGIFVAGSPYGTTTPAAQKSATQVRAEEELTHLFHDILEADTPCLATGYGMEVATSVMGGDLNTHWAEEPSMTDVHITVEGRDDSLLADFPPDFLVYTGHHEAVETPPEGAVILGRSITCPIQIMRLGRHFWVTQFNPELDSDVISARLQRYEDAGYGASEDFTSLVLVGREGPGDHQAGQLIRNFIGLARAAK